MPQVEFPKTKTNLKIGQIFVILEHSEVVTFYSETEFVCLYFEFDPEKISTDGVGRYQFFEPHILLESSKEFGSEALLSIDVDILGSESRKAANSNYIDIYEVADMPPKTRSNTGNFFLTYLNYSWFH